MRRKMTVWLVFLMLLGILPGCGKMAASAETVPTQDLTAILLEDYDQLWRDLEENYPFFPILEEQGIDVIAVRDSYRLYVQKTATLEQFMGVLDRMFGKLQCFAHLSLFHRDRYEMMADFLIGIEGFDQWNAVINDPVTVKTYASLPGNTGGGAETVPAVECAYYHAEKAAYFRFPTMNDYARERDERVIADYLAQIPDVEHIIIDITGNSGGSSLYWENVIMKPFGGTWTGDYRIFYQDSPINERYYGDRELISVSGIPLPEFAKMLDAALYENVHWDVDYGASSVDSGADAKRWVLTKGGYSAAESFAAFCKLTGWATLVGRPTNGDGLGGNPLLLSLKNTGLLVYLTTAMAENPDGSLNAQIGITPDHVLLPKDDRTPLEFCLDLIRSEEKEVEKSR